MLQNASLVLLARIVPKAVQLTVKSQIVTELMDPVPEGNVTLDTQKKTAWKVHTCFKHILGA